MRQSIAEKPASRHRVIGEMRPTMAKAALPKGESADYLAELGRCLDFARRSVGWTVDELAGKLARDSKQVARWLRGEERTQVDTVFQVTVLRKPFVIALAKLAECDVETTVRISMKEPA